MPRSEDLQIRIMKELSSPGSFQWNIRESYASIAKRVGVDEETVRRKVKSAEQTGVLAGWRLILNPHLLGMEAASIVLDVYDEHKKAAIVSQVKLIDGVVIMMDLGTELQLMFYYENQRTFHRVIELIKAICGSKESLQMTGWFPRCRLALSHTDWSIIKELSDDPRGSLLEIASKLKISTRTVKRRITRMTEGNAFFMVPRVNFKNIPGISCRFLVIYSDEKMKLKNDEIVRTHLERIVFSYTSGTEVSAFSVPCRNMSEVQEIHKWFTALDGVKDVRKGIMKDLVLVSEWLDDQVEKQIAASV